MGDGWVEGGGSRLVCEGDGNGVLGVGGGDGLVVMGGVLKGWDEGVWWGLTLGGEFGGLCGGWGCMGAIGFLIKN